MTNRQKETSKLVHTRVHRLPGEQGNRNVLRPPCCLYFATQTPCHAHEGYPEFQTNEMLFQTRCQLCHTQTACAFRTFALPSFRLNDVGSLHVSVAACPAFCN